MTGLNERMKKDLVAAVMLVLLAASTFVVGTKIAKAASLNEDAAYASDASWSDVKELIESVLGTPYNWSNKAINGYGDVYDEDWEENGWDCSGFVGYILYYGYGLTIDMSETNVSNIADGGSTSWSTYSIYHLMHDLGTDIGTFDGDDALTDFEEAYAEGVIKAGDIILFGNSSDDAVHVAIVGDDDSFYYDGYTGISIYHALNTTYNTIEQNIEWLWAADGDGDLGNKSYTYFRVFRGLGNQEVDLTITKTSSDATLTASNSSYSLDGAVYSIYEYEDDETLGDFVATVTLSGDGDSASGTVTLDAGTYWVVETTAPTGYSLDSEWHLVTLEGEDYTLEAEDTPITTTVIFIKTSGNESVVSGDIISSGTTATGEETEYSLEGAVYEIYLASDDSYVTSITLDANGKATIEGLAINTAYYALEVEAPAGFALNSEKVSFTTAEATIEVGTSDEPGTVVFHIYKSDASGSTQTGVSLAGAVFQLVDCNGEAHTATSDADGLIVFDDDIPLGSYTITEVSAPEGYEVSSETLTGTVTADELSEAQTEDGVNYVTVELSIEETPTAFDIQITKTATDSSDTTDSGEVETLEGVAFEVYYTDDGGKEHVVATLVTNEDGYINTSDSDWCLWAVEAGYIDSSCLYEIGTVSGVTYYGLWFGEGERADSCQGAFPYNAYGYSIREVESTTTEGYVTADEWSISTDSMVNGVTLKYVVNNATVTSYLTVVKYDAETGEVVPLSGFSFQLYTEIDEDGAVVESSLVTMTDVYPTMVTLDTFTTDENGMVTLPETLNVGTYYLVEVDVVAPYLLSDEVLSFTIDDEGETGVVTVVAFEDEHVHGQATLTKTCSLDGEPLEGAVYNLIALEDVLASDGTVIYTENQVIDTLATDEAGQLTTSLLELGAEGTASFAFVEIEAPEGHVLDSTPIEFTLSYVDDETAIVTCEVTATDVPTEVQFYKTDLSGAAVAGAVFAYWNVDDEISASGAAIRVDATEVTVTQVIDYCQVTFDVPDGWTVVFYDEDGEAYTYDGEDLLLPAGTYTAEIFDADGADVLNDDLTDELEAGVVYTVSGTDAFLLFSASASMSETDTIDTSVSVTYDDDQDFWDVSGLMDGSTYTVTVDGTEVGTFTFEGETLYFTVEDDALVSEVVLLASGATATEVEVDDDGAAVIYHLTSGTYHMVEVSVPAGYTIDSSVWTFTIDEDGYATATEVCQYHIETMGDIDEGWYTEAQLVQLGIDSSVYESLVIASTEDEDGTVTCTLTATTVEGTVETITFTEDEMRDVNATVEVEVEDHVCVLVVADDVTKLDIFKYDVTGGTEVEGAELVITDTDGNVLYEWTSTTEPYRICGIEPGDYLLYEYMTPHTYDEATVVEFTVEETGVVQTVVMYDEPIEISGDIDKKQEIADPTALYTEENGDGENTAEVSVSETGSYDYTLDYENTSSTWVDEFTVTDYLECAVDGLAYLTGITTPQASGDYDGLMNVWYVTNLTASDYVEDTDANATLSDGHENSWLTNETVVAAIGDDARVLDYTGWELWAEDVSTTTSTYLSVDDLDLEEGEYVIAFRFEYGRVEAGFTTRTDGWDAETRYDLHDDIDDADIYTVSITDEVVIEAASSLGTEFLWNGEWVTYDELLVLVEDGTLSCDDGVFTLAYDPEVAYEYVYDEDGALICITATTVYSTYTFSEDEVSNPEVSVSYTIDGELWEELAVSDTADIYITANSDGTYSLVIDVYDTPVYCFSYTDADGEEQTFSVSFPYRSLSDVEFPCAVEDTDLSLTYEDGTWYTTDEDGNVYELSVVSAIGSFGVTATYTYTLEEDQVTGMDGLASVSAIDGCIVSVAATDNTDDATDETSVDDSTEFTLDEDNAFDVAAGTYTVSSLLEALGADEGYLAYDEDEESWVVTVIFGTSSSVVIFYFEEADETYGIEADHAYTLETFAAAIGLEDAVLEGSVITGTIDGEEVSFQIDYATVSPTWIMEGTVTLNDIDIDTDTDDFAYASAIIHMQVTDAYVEGTVLANEAQVDLYRNGGNIGDETSLEDHDSDRVEQTPKTVLPEIGTTLTDTEGDHYATPDEELTLTDVVAYEGIEVGVEHVMYGTLMDAETGEVVVDADGNAVTASTTFTPETEDGTVEVTFTFNASDLAGHDVVAFETLVVVETSEMTDEDTGNLVTSTSETVVATHADLTDEGQTVSIVSGSDLVQTGTAIVCAAVALIVAGAALIALSVMRNRKRDAIE